MDHDSQSNLICVVSIRSIRNADAIIATTIIITIIINISIVIILIIGGHHRHLCGHWASWRRLTPLTFFQMLAIPTIKLVIVVEASDIIILVIFCTPLVFFNKPLRLSCLIYLIVFCQNAKSLT